MIEELIRLHNEAAQNLLKQQTIKKTIKMCPDNETFFRYHLKALQVQYATAFTEMAKIFANN